MKVILRISLVLNLILLGVLFVWLTSARKANQPPAPVSPLETMAAPTVVPTVKTEQWHWIQLVNPNDYHIFVNNLRSIGCPEPTLHDIVAGDANRAFAFKRHQLKLDGSGTGAWSYQAEDRLVASLLGKTYRADLAEAATRKGNMEPPVEAIIYPLVFKTVDLDALGLDEEQKAAVVTMQQQFIEAIGGANQDTSDPAYLARWQVAQPEMDDTMRGMLGAEIFQKYQLAAQASNAESPAANP
jgi:hypothetical protein